MKKLLLSTSILSVLALTGCGDDTSLSSIVDDHKDNKVIAATRVSFDPSNGVLSVPNDLLFSTPPNDLTKKDGTLNIPVADEADLSDPTVALNTLDGWSVQQPFTIDFVLPAGVDSLDANSVAQPGAIRIFEVVMGASLVDSDCASVQAGLACKMVGELSAPVNFVTTLADKDTVAIVPVTPFKPGSSYLVVVTNALMDSLGRDVEPSSTYITVRQNIQTHPLGSASQLALQGLVNSFESVLAGAGIDLDTVIHTSAMTIQSAGSSISALKAGYAKLLSENSANLPMLTHVANSTLTIRDMFVAAGAIDAATPQCATIAPTLAAVAGTEQFATVLAQMQSLIGICAGEVHFGSISLPYYLSAPSSEEPTAPLNKPWKAMCDSGAILASATQEQLASATPGPNHDACQALNLADLGLDVERNLTKYNPVPMATGLQNIKVQMTLPNLSLMQAIDPTFAQPDSGWPVVILTHGLSRQKEDMLALASTLSTQGFATIAIDQPLHGERGFDINGSPDSKEIVASGDNPLAFANLQNLQVMRDNIRQSVIDLLGLRVGLTRAASSDFDGHQLDPTKVYFAGISLGAMWGLDFVTLANTPLNPALDPAFKVNASVLASPGGGTANFMLESIFFGPYIKSNLILSFIEPFLPTLATTIGDDVAYAQAKASFVTQAGLTGDDLLTFEAAEQFVLYLLAQGVDLTKLNGEVYRTHYANFKSNLMQNKPTLSAVLDATFNSFAFAVQTMIDAGDPNSYASQLAATGTPILITEIFGDGTASTWDDVIPPTTSTPLSGTEQFIRLLNLPVLDSNAGDGTANVSGFVRFNKGTHGSLLSAGDTPEVTAEMHSQVVSFFKSDGKLIKVNSGGGAIVPAN
ncbi:hypothetical protein C2869_13090 [Saccharobesus litoralis]|uniref:Bacterial virulence factor lipase N-terminal domain-containing protein n=1 Tax=Saccharobesus litoralis TaxID=2172099 RepID=A0A2S0VSX5_9ALTE|nr:VolA/Pla-1 family phospholipase [Saccharobesus litoralis]AWB67318.1 hypothetical protein C2869_13090 [Saccharobesus litoralis]